MFQKGERISKYEIRQELGGGYFGTTYKAFDTITQNDVALKVISNLKHFNFESFAREARMLFELSHPNIIKYFESNFFTLRGRKIYYIAMEFAQRGTLRDVLNTFDFVRSTEVTLQILRGLEAIHSKGILHSDLKPDNILIDANSNIKISDFGVAKMGVGTHYFGSPAGSPLYMAPEQFLKGKTSVRTDIWSVGIILYEMIYKKRPYENIQEIIDVNFHPHYSNGTQREKKVNEFIRTCLQRDESNRFKNIRKMIEFFESQILPVLGETSTKVQPVVVTEKLSEVGFYNRGVDYASAGDMDQAAAYYTEAIKIDPYFANAFYNRGLANFEKGLFKEAIDDFSEAIDLKRDFADAYFGRANARLTMGDFDRAIDDYGEALIYDPADPEVYFNRGLAYEDIGDAELALADYSEAIKLKPDFATAYHNRGVCYEEKGDLEMAVGDYTEAMIYKAGFADAFFARGNAYFKMKDYERAIGDYTQAIALRPDDAEAYFNRGYAHDDNGNTEMAIADYSKVIQMKPEFEQAYINRGHLHRKAGNTDDATEDFIKARRLRSHKAV